MECIVSPCVRQEEEETPDASEMTEFERAMEEKRELLLKKQGDAEEAARLGQRALAIWEKALGADHPYAQFARRWWG